MFIAVTSTIAQNWTQPKYLSGDKQINKLQNIYAME